MTLYTPAELRRLLGLSEGQYLELKRRRHVSQVQPRRPNGERMALRKLEYVAPVLVASLQHRVVRGDL